MSRKLDFRLGGTLEIFNETAGYALFTIEHQSMILTARGDNMAYKLPNDHTVKVKVSYVDAKGNPAAVDGDVTWDSSNDAIISVMEEGSDTTQVQLIPGPTLGQAQVSATVDADLGEGIKELITIMNVEVVAGSAVTGTIEPVAAPEPIA